VRDYAATLNDKEVGMAEMSEKFRQKRGLHRRAGSEEQ
jgi:hypothetical protein